jgi:BMFP domain-containing protein YqiC
MSETATLESIVRRLDGLQNNVSGVTRRMITLENTLSDRMAALEARLAGFEECADQLSDRIGALEARVNYLILLVERIGQE